MRVKLTKKVAEKAPIPPTGERTIRYDTVVPGFGLRVTDRGVRSFFAEYGPRTRRRRMRVGNIFPATTVETARGLAKDLLDGYSKGVDPLDERDKQRDMPGWRAWVETYLKDVASAKKDDRADKRYLGLAVEKWGRKPLDTISTSDVEKVFRSIAAGGHKTAANRWLASVRACLQHAWRNDKIPSNPAMKVKPLPEPDPRHRILSDDEFKALLAAIAALEDPFTRTAMTVLVETGCRVSEILHAKHEDLDFSAGTWRIPRPKSGKPETLPLAPSTVEVLRKLPRVLGNPYLIVGRLPGTHRADLKGAWETVKEAAKLDKVRLHDIRKTFGYHVAKAAGLATASRLLRHSDVRVTERHYASLEDADLRAGLTKRAEVLAFKPATKKKAVAR